MKQWIVEDNILKLKTDDSVFVPSAAEINAFANGLDVCGILAEPDTPDLSSSQLSFSRLPVKLSLHLYKKGSAVGYEIHAVRNGMEIPVKFKKFGGADHVIFGKRWHYLGADFHALEALMISDETSVETIPFSIYISLLKGEDDFSTVSIFNEVPRNFEIADDEHAPASLKATLYPYQETGYRWIRFVEENGCGCILGDEMGLGKTLQIIAVMEDRKPRKKAPFLVVAPVSLLINWQREINRFAPDLKTYIYYGSDRTGLIRDLLPYDVIITAYSTIVSDLSMFMLEKWDIIVLDEAQNIKNPEATRTVCVKQIPRRVGIAVTGTPFENHMTDLWSLIDFVAPGTIGTLKEFTAAYDDSIDGASRIEPVLSALMIRRRVKDVAKDLPDRVDTPQTLVMEDEEAAGYEQLRKATENGAHSGLSLGMFVKMRMYCAHPFLLTEYIARRDPAEASAKYMRFCEILEEIIASGEKAIVFTSYVRMAEIMADDIPKRFNIPVMIINGSTPVSDRQGIVDSFNNYSEPAVLALNPRAAGTGLNITGANHVIHYNLEWNPALEDQATARSYRRGQSRTVFVYRLYYADTVEEVINDKLNSKRILSGQAVVNTDVTTEDGRLLVRALALSPARRGNE